MNILDISYSNISYTEDTNGQRKINYTLNYKFLGEDGFYYKEREERGGGDQFYLFSGSLNQNERITNMIYPSGSYDASIVLPSSSSNTITGKITMYNKYNIQNTYREEISNSLNFSTTLASNNATVPESATIGFDNVTENSVLIFWNPHGDGGSPITSYHVTLKKWR